MIRKVYEGINTREIVFPLGGIGTGSIGLAGNGRLMDWEIRNRPNKGSMLGMSHIAVKAVSGGRLIDARVLNGDLQKDLIGQYGTSSFGTGASGGTMAGFPHFENCTFTGEFPFAHLDFSDKGFPGKACLTAFNPFIPLDNDASSIPAAFFEIDLENPTDADITYSVAFTLGNPFSEQGKNSRFDKGTITGIRLHQEALDAADIGYGELVVAAKPDERDEVCVQEYWYRGSWFDGAGIYWRDFCSDKMPERSYEATGKYDMSTICVSRTLRPGMRGSFRFVLSWNFPNNYNYWNPDMTQDEKHRTWKNYYAILFHDAIDSACYSLNNWDSLYSRSRAFTQVLFSSTLPEVVLEAAAANLAVLKSPTVLRLEDGSLYGWEGCRQKAGSCEGSCTHVWNYTYAVPFLFPSLERSMRDLEYNHNIWDNGMMSFRLNLPIGRDRFKHRACVDGQMGGVVRCYREWKLSGDDEWLKRIWPAVKKSIAYAWDPTNMDKWDHDKDGVIDGRQHHTLDMELFGPNSWLQGFYLAALKAAEEIACYFGENTQADEYRKLFDSGKKWCDQNLFNGEYYIQQVDLEDKSLLEQYGDATGKYWNDEGNEIKYQIGDGCEIDQVCAQWHADICGLGDIYDRTKLISALESIYRYNYKTTMRDFFNPCRLFAVNGESGTVICDYPPNVRKPIVPIPYCEESMHGFEYQAGAQMILNGMEKEGLTLIQSIRDRYDGSNRNPYNEIECGTNYARSMASYSLIPIYSGFFFDLPNGIIGFDPISYEEGVFKSIWSVGTGWGNVRISKNTVDIRITEGSLSVRAIRLPFISADSVVRIICDYKEYECRYESPDVRISEEISVNELISIMINKINDNVYDQRRL